MEVRDPPHGYVGADVDFSERDSTRGNADPEIGEIVAVQRVFRGKGGDVRAGRVEGAVAAFWGPRDRDVEGSRTCGSAR